MNFILLAQILHQVCISTFNNVPPKHLNFGVYLGGGKHQFSEAERTKFQFQKISQGVFCKCVVSFPVELGHGMGAGHCRQVAADVAMPRPERRLGEGKYPTPSVLDTA